MNFLMVLFRIYKQTNVSKHGLLDSLLATFSF